MQIRKYYVKMIGKWPKLNFYTFSGAILYWHQRYFDLV